MPTPEEYNKVTRYYTLGPKGEKIYTPNYSREVSTTTSVAPDENTVKYFNESVRPIVEKQHGLEFDDKGNLTTPLSRFVHFDPEKERQRREQEQKLNEWKRKEANWYNGISVLMDIATAAGGGKVGKRTPSDAAAQAVADNERLRKEQQAEDYMVEKAKQDKVAAFYKDISDRMTALNGKVTTKETEKPMQEVERLATKETEKPTQEVEKPSNVTSTTKTKSGSTKTILFNTGAEGSTKIDVDFDKNTYEHIGNLLIDHYEELIRAADASIIDPGNEPGIFAKEEKKEKWKKDKENYDKAKKYQEELYKLLEKYHTKDKGKITWDIGRLLSSGEFYNLSDSIKNYITEASGGKVRFGTPIEMDNGLMKETVIIDNGGFNDLDGDKL